MNRAQYEQWLVEYNAAMVQACDLDDKVTQWLLENGMCKGYIEYSLSYQPDCIIVVWHHDENRPDVRIPIENLTESA